MKGNKIELLLNTPIQIELPEDQGPHKIRIEIIVKIFGTVLELSEAGLTLEPSELFTERKLKVAFPRKWIFIPLHKIDHCLSIS